MRHSLGNVVALAVGLTLGVLLTSALYGSSGPLNSNGGMNDGSLNHPCQMFKIDEGNNRIV